MSLDDQRPDIAAPLNDLLREVRDLRRFADDARVILANLEGLAERWQQMADTAITEEVRDWLGAAARTLRAELGVKA